MFSRPLLPLILAALILPPTAMAETAAQSVYDKVRPFIVVVRASGAADAENADGETHGSGVIIGANEIATNCHVVADAKTIAVFRAADDKPLAATLSRGDYGRDICILSVAGMQNGQTAAIRKSKTLKVGETVFAVGAPQGFDYTITDGIISQLRALGDSPPLIQTNAAISPGSSGGGLFDANGNLVGLTTFYHREGQNLNFAVPTEWLEEVGKKAAGEVAGKDEKAEIAAGVGFLDKALELRDAEDWQAMLAHCRRWTGAEQWNSVAWFYLGFVYGELGRYDNAIAAYREALRISPELAVAWYNLGNAYHNLGRYDDAIAAYREALRIDAEYADAWNNLGIAYDNLGRYDDAIAALREALRIDPEGAVAWYNLGNAYGKFGRYDDAIAAFREALRIDLEHANAWYGLGVAYRKLDRYDDAVAAFREELRIDPEYAFVWYNLGFVYGKLSRYDDAIAAYREALRIDPEYADAWRNLGIAYRAQGRNAEADEANQKYLRLKILSDE